MAATRVSDEGPSGRSNQLARPGAQLRLDYLGPPGEVAALVRALRGAGIDVRYRPPLVLPDQPAMLTAVVLTLVAPHDARLHETAVRRIADRFTATRPRTTLRLSFPPPATTP